MAQLKKTVRDIMTREVIVFKRSTPVKDAAEQLSKASVGGAPVVDDEGNLVGIVTDGDLIMQDVKLHFPTYVQLLDGYIYVPGSLQRFEHEFRKAIGATVGDVMTEEVITTDEDATIEDVATIMVDQDVSRLPVVADGKLIGIVTKGDLVRAIVRT
jgi:CBS domain-containing protein